MYRYCFLLICFFYLQSETLAIAMHWEPAISNIQANAKSVPLYEKFELTFQAQGNWDNPFDPEQVAIDCKVYPPEGAPYWIPAFYFQDYHRSQIGNTEIIEPVGTPCWKVRLTPTVPGTYRYQLRMKNGQKVIETKAGNFDATTNSNKRGFVRVSKENPYYFEFENGDPYFVVGENMLVGEVSSMEKYMSSLARAGGNFIRTWWCNRGIDLESTVSDHPDRGLGKINQQAAWVADYQLDLADKLGVAVMVCFETQQFLRSNVRWDRFTYNAANGGPVNSPGEYFINADAAKYFKRRLRYIVARWSYATSVFSWQFWNEVNSANNFNVEQAADWHREMARYLREIDPYNHIIHTNFGHLDGREPIDAQPEMEVVSTNSYSRRDMAQTAVWAARWMTSRYKKPYLLTEYGLGHEGGWAENDPKGIMVHNGLWGAAIGGSAGGALPWGWGNWIDAQNLYHYFDAFSKTFRDVPFHRLNWKQVDFSRFIFNESQGNEPIYSNAFFEGFPRNYSFEVCPDPKSNVFQITDRGEVENAACFNAALLTGRASYLLDTDAQDDFSAMLAATSRQTLNINMPIDGQLIVYVPEMGRNQNPVLSVEVNGHLCLNESLRNDGADATWAYFKAFPVNIPAGRHEITIANAQIPTENKWQNVLYVAYELTNYRFQEGPNLLYEGLQSEDHIFIWLRNPDFTWMFDRMGRIPVKQPSGILTLENVATGTYTILWRDTITGEELGREVVKSNKGQLQVATPSIDKSAVAHLIRMKRIN